MRSFIPRCAAPLTSWSRQPGFAVATVSAGVYNLTQPEMAGDLLERKMKHIQSTGALTVATANPGCLLQLINGAAQRDMKLRIVHPITLLAEAYRRSSQPTR